MVIYERGLGYGFYLCKHLVFQVCSYKVVSSELVDRFCGAYDFSRRIDAYYRNRSASESIFSEFTAFMLSPAIRL